MNVYDGLAGGNDNLQGNAYSTGYRGSQIARSSAMAMSRSHASKLTSCSLPRPQDSYSEVRILEWLSQNSNNNVKKPALQRNASRSILNLTNRSQGRAKELKFCEELESIYEDNGNSQENSNLVVNTEHPRRHSLADIQTLKKSNRQSTMRRTSLNGLNKHIRLIDPVNDLKNHEEDFRIDLHHLKEPTQEKMDQLKYLLLEDSRSHSFISPRTRMDSRRSAFLHSPEHKLLEYRSTVSRDLKL